MENKVKASEAKAELKRVETAINENHAQMKAIIAKMKGWFRRALWSLYEWARWKGALGKLKAARFNVDYQVYKAVKEELKAIKKANG